MFFNSNLILKIGFSLAAFSVGIGAFGAHGLKDLLIENNRLATFQTAVEYQFYHVFAIIITGLLAKNNNTVSFSKVVFCFVFGIFIFSGSLYLLSITNITFLGAITPIGGLLFIIGWLLLFATHNKVNKI